MAPETQKDRSTFRLRPRTLLVLTGAATCVLAGPVLWDYWYRAQVSPLTDAEARELLVYGALPVEVLDQNQRPSLERSEQSPPFDPRLPFVAEYRPAYIPANRLVHSAGNLKTLTNYQGHFAFDRAIANTATSKMAEDFLAACRENDRPDPHVWIVHGVIVDAAGKTISTGRVSIADGNQGSVSAEVRDDGTFSLTLNFDTRNASPPPEGYWTRFLIKAGPNARDWYQTKRILFGPEVLLVRLTLPVPLPNNAVASASSAKGR